MEKEYILDKLLLENLGGEKVRKLKIKITVGEGSSLHIGAANNLLTGKKGEVYKINGIPVIPASSFKGALRSQLERYFIENHNKLKKELKVKKDEYIEPCIPTTQPSKAEEQLKNYRNDKTICQITIDDKTIKLPIINGDEIGICPVCYFMGAAGIPGFIRIHDFWPEHNYSQRIIEKTEIRIDRSTNVTSHGSSRTGEIVKPRTVFSGFIEIIEMLPNGFEFGKARIIKDESHDKIIDKWLQENTESVKDKLLRILIENISEIKILGGWKSKGSGRVSITVDSS